MVVSNIIGGLGNQMFQYAMARSLTLAMGAELKLDVADFSGYSLHHGFELARLFNVSSLLATEREIQALLGWRGNRLCRKVLRYGLLSSCRGSKFVVEPGFGYWDGVKEVCKDCYLVGYWQSEKYFSGKEQNIRADFTFKTTMSARNSELAARINDADSVSLHVRRGDYVTDHETNSILGVCTPDYYQSAISHISNRVSSPTFFVFSDDISWAKANLKIGFPCEYVDHNHGAESYNDMRLMSLCRHHIIANSSFSWWGAWLNPRRDKIVVAPGRWFVNDFRTDDLIPDHWISL